MKRWYLLILMAFLAAGCVRQVQQPTPSQQVPPVPQNQNGAPPPTDNGAIDANDYLDTALDELDTVENLDVD